MPKDHVLRWSGYEHEHIERGSDWYIALGIVAVCIAIVAIIMHDALFALLIIVAAGVIGMLANVPPEYVDFEISERGVRVGKDLHRFDEIVTFWVEDEHDAPPLLLIDTTKFMSPNIVIPIHDVAPSDVRDLLRKHATEVPMREPFAHKILEFFGF
jgi:hypothetical protein